MRVRLLTALRYRDNWHPARTLLDLPDGLAQSVIDGGAAEPVEQAKAISSPPNIKARLSAPRNKEA